MPPVDEEAERVIRQHLLDAFPGWGYRGEETGSVAGAEPFQWLVDPNDGTSAYLKGWRGSAVSIALLHKGMPVLGVVYAFGYPDDLGDLIAWAQGCPLTRNGRALASSLTDRKLDRQSIVFLSQDADRSPGANAECVRPARYTALPSIAYRLARVAAGDGVAAVSLNGPGAWDYAAGHALLRASDGVLLNEEGREVAYTPDGHSSTQWCFGGSPAAARELVRRDWGKVFVPSPQPAPPYWLVRPVRGRTVPDGKMLASAQGCLLGQLVGDSLGGLVEFKSLAAIRKEYPQGCRDLKDGGTWGILAGQPTDDSELALMLARTIVHAGRYDANAALDAYVHWYRSGPFDIGGTIGRALRAAASAHPGPDRVVRAGHSANGPSESNGSLMRVSPLGILGAGRPDQAAAWAREDSRLTHPNQVCQDACAVFVSALATAIAHGVSPESTYAAALAEAAKPGVHVDVLQAVKDASSAPPKDYTSQMGWVLIALQNALYHLLHATTLEEGVVDTVMRGGDTDTNGAIAGALLGAVHGRRGVPARWVEAVLTCRPLPPATAGNAHPRPVEFWPVDVLELAEALLALGLGEGPARHPE
jgi:ADP-ribosylglycohydrolase/fructose-1,6-bisphosphatase/inositol monophosphatase family enzyme